MISFFIFDGVKRKCSALSVVRAIEIIKLMFPRKKAYVVEDNKVPFAQNMGVDEAEVDAGIKSQPMMSMEVLAPKVTEVKKPAKKSAAKKTKIKSKVVVKSKSKNKAKKTKIKSKVVVKPKTKAKKLTRQSNIKVVAKKSNAKKK